jgi:low temperature requirement protein LtrA
MAAMVAMIVVDLAAPATLGEYALLFGAAYFMVRVLHVLRYAKATRADKDVHGVVLRLAPGTLPGATLILVAWFVSPGPVRALLWALSIIIDFGTPLVALGVSAAGEELSAGLVTAAALGVAIVLVALGLKKTLLDIEAPLMAVVSVALFGGMALYLLAHVAFRLRNIRTVNVQRLVVSGNLIALIPVGALLPSLTSLCILAGVLVALVTYEAILFREIRHRIRLNEP